MLGCLIIIITIIVSPCSSGIEGVIWLSCHFSHIHSDTAQRAQRTLLHSIQIHSSVDTFVFVYTHLRTVMLFEKAPVSIKCKNSMSKHSNIVTVMKKLREKVSKTGNRTHKKKSIDLFHLFEQLIFIQFDFYSSSLYIYLLNLIFSVFFSF